MDTLRTKHETLIGGAMLSAVCAFALFHSYAAYSMGTGFEIDTAAWGLLAYKSFVEILALAFGLFFLVLSLSHVLLRAPSREGAPYCVCPPAAILYLCCDDIDVNALDSLARLEYGTPLTIIIHDDSTDLQSKQRVDEILDDLRQRHPGRAFLLLRRPDKSGGKPGAVNYAIKKTRHLHDLVLICDNDSYAVDTQALEKAAAYFHDPAVAVVQCHTVSRTDDRYCTFNRMLSSAIDAFHVVLLAHARFGWMPFIGHNAVLRTSAFEEVGGLTPGFFADDLDVTVRLNEAGYRIVYAHELSFAEDHPPSYGSFRKRSYKWAYGCIQTLRAHSLRVLRSRRFSLGGKLGFFGFSGFFGVQALLLLYLIAVIIAGPFILPHELLYSLGSFWLGVIILTVIYSPTIAYVIKATGKRRAAIGMLLTGWIAYGATEFTTSRGVLDGLLKRKRRWVPTNAAGTSAGWLVLWGEMFFGLALFLVPFYKAPFLLSSPALCFFAVKFFFAPAVGLIYNNARSRRPSCAAALLALALALTAAATAEARIAIDGKNFVLDGSPFVVKGIHYSPWEPGTGPGKDYPYPSPERVTDDLAIVRSANANAVLVYDPPGYVLDLAHEYGLMLVYCFYIDWWSLGDEAYEDRIAEILETVEAFKDKPALMGWLLGNEIPVYALEERGDALIRDALRSLYDKIKKIDPHTPVSHSNWPITRDLPLGFFDFSAFNLYPLWPPEVVARGYGNYIRDVLQPIAEDRPLLITEFGVNTLEAGESGQARFVRHCWEELRRAGAAGGFVFAFADEWWKNYDNPIRDNVWWSRVPAPDDELTHNKDPEEHYGILYADRTPKPAFRTVQVMFDEGETRRNRIAIFIAVFFLAAFSIWIWAKFTR